MSYLGYPLYVIPDNVKAELLELVQKPRSPSTRGEYDYMANLILNLKFGTRKVHCPCCQKLCLGAYDLRDHFNSRHLRFPSCSCEHCHKRYFSQKTLNQHLRRVHGVTPLLNAEGKPREQLNSPSVFMSTPPANQESAMSPTATQAELDKLFLELFGAAPPLPTVFS